MKRGVRVTVFNRILLVLFDIFNTCKHRWWHRSVRMDISYKDCLLISDRSLYCHLICVEKLSISIKFILISLAMALSIKPVMCLVLVVSFMRQFISILCRWLTEEQSNYAVHNFDNKLLRFLVKIMIFLADMTIWDSSNHEK